MTGWNVAGGWELTTVPKGRLLRPKHRERRPKRPDDAAQPFNVWSEMVSLRAEKRWRGPANLVAVSDGGNFDLRVSRKAPRRRFGWKDRSTPTARTGVFRGARVSHPEDRQQKAYWSCRLTIGA